MKETSFLDACITYSTKYWYKEIKGMSVKLMLFFFFQNITIKISVNYNFNMVCSRVDVPILEVLEEPIKASSHLGILTRTD